MIRLCPCGIDHANNGIYCSPECREKAWRKNYWKNNHSEGHRISQKKSLRSITLQYEKLQKAL